MVKKPLPPEQVPERRTGRAPGPTEDLRSERLVQRIHPDLMSVLIQRAREAGISRSLYVEKILIQFVNTVEGAALDNIGRRRPPGQPASFQQKIDPLNLLRGENGHPPDLDYARPNIGPGLGRQNAAYAARESRPSRPKKKK